MIITESEFEKSIIEFMADVLPKDVLFSYQRKNNFNTFPAVKAFMTGGKRWTTTTIPFSLDASMTFPEIHSEVKKSLKMLYNILEEKQEISGVDGDIPTKIGSNLDKMLSYRP